MLVSIETTALVAAALEMQSAIDAAPENITIKCGITSGDVILLEGDDYIGHAVNVASRLCDLATAHEVLVLSSVLPQVPPWSTVESKELVSLPGLEHEIEVARLGFARKSADSVPDPVCRILLTKQSAALTRLDGDGVVLLFCSASCADTWDQRFTRGDPDAGSVRELWMR